MYQHFKSFQQTTFKDTVLFHGTQPENVVSILKHGLSHSYGSAILSPSFEKCDCFVSHNSQKGALVVCVTALGNVTDNTISENKYVVYNNVQVLGFHGGMADVLDNAQVLPILAIYYENQKNSSPFSHSFMSQLTRFPGQSNIKWLVNNGNTSSRFNYTFPTPSSATSANFNLPPLSASFNQNVSQLPPITSLSSFTKFSTNWTLRKAQGMMQQWIQQVDLSRGIFNFYGATIADEELWPVKSNGNYQYLESYFKLVLSNTSKLDQGFINTLKKLKSYEGIVQAKRRQVEMFRSVNLSQAISFATQDRLQEANSSQESCSICAELIISLEQPISEVVKMNNCPHVFHKSCIETWLYMPSSQMICPNCKTPCHDPMAPPPIGPMPDGEMAYIFSEKLGAWFICYSIPNGTQLSCHSSPGRRFKGTTRTAICPIYSKWGPFLFIRILAAFYYHHTFTVGTSLTTNMPNVITWNGIHHKTTIDGGFGFPDSTYEERVSLELDGKGILLFLRDWVPNQRDLVSNQLISDTQSTDTSIYTGYLVNTPKRC